VNAQQLELTGMELVAEHNGNTDLLAAPTHVYDPDLGPIAITDLSAKDKKRLARATIYGAWLAYPEDGAAEYHEVFMVVINSGRVRFIARGAKQYGPEHKSIYAAYCWAFGHGWHDADATHEQNVQCIVEIRSNSTLLSDRCAKTGGSPKSGETSRPGPMAPTPPAIERPVFADRSDLPDIATVHTTGDRL
jgi:hypothetical protein